MTKQSTPIEQLKTLLRTTAATLLEHCATVKVS